MAETRPDGAAEEPMRRCARCGQVRPLEEYHIQYRPTGERLTWCRSCMAEAKRAWYARRRDHQKARVKLNSERTTRENQARAWEYLGQHPCVDCGESDPVVLQFDHVGVKRKNVSHMLGGGFRWSEIEAEIANCEVRCGNCHRRKTAREQGIYERKSGFGRVQESAAAYAA